MGNGCSGNRKSTMIDISSSQKSSAFKQPHSSELSASSHETAPDSSGKAEVAATVEQASGRSAIAGSVTSVPSSERISSLLSKIEFETVDNLPKTGAAEAPSAAATRLRVLLGNVDKGEMPTATDLKGCLDYAATVLESVSKTKPYASLKDDGDKLPDVTGEVRDWLESTFTKRSSIMSFRENGPKITLRGVVHAVRMHVKLKTFFKQRTGPQYVPRYPQAVRELFQTMNEWSFDVFYLNRVSHLQPLRYLGFEVFRKYDLMSKFEISGRVLDAFLIQIESGYNRHSNPYHNAAHAADVTQATHSLLWQTGLMNWLTDLEVLSSLLAAMIHDLEHTGTTNTFHIISRSEIALLYNDKSVLENYHLSTAFRLMRQEECNILSNLAKEEFSEVRTFVIDMVLATDMSFHFQQLNEMKSVISEATGPESIDKAKALAFCLHCCDISNPAREWNVHSSFTEHLMEEFFLQGDREKKLGLPCSPLCDRSSTLVPESQVGFIDFIVKPLFDSLKDMLDTILPLSTEFQTMGDIAEDPREGDSAADAETQHKHAIWIETVINNCVSNRDYWKKRCRTKPVVSATEDDRSETRVSDSQASEFKLDDTKQNQSIILEQPRPRSMPEDGQLRLPALVAVGQPKSIGPPKLPEIQTVEKQG